MSRRILPAGLLGGLAMYVWSSLAHIVLPLGQTGIREIPDESSLLSPMRTALGSSPGLYMFPGMGGSTDMKLYEAKLASNPSGLLVYNPPGNTGMTPGRLAVEFLSEMSEALLLAWLMARSRLKGIGGRLGFALAVGIAAAVSTNVSYWNWYGFPGSYTAVYMGIEIVGFLAAGLVAAKMLGAEPLA